MLKYLTGKLVKGGGVADAQTVSVPQLPVTPEVAVTAAEIHAAINTTADAIVSEARDLLAQAANEDEATAVSLGDRGFGAAACVKEARALREKRAEAERVAGIAEKYPMHRYISEDGVKSVCEKYGLILGEANKFIGDIPAKNAREITAFKYADGNNVFRVTYWRGNWDSSVIVEAKNAEDAITIAKSKAWLGADGHSAGPAPFSVVAPASMFDKRDAHLEGHKLVQNVKDPIVLAPLGGGGYIIVTAWGEEAGDPLVVNPKKN